MRASSCRNCWNWRADSAHRSRRDDGSAAQIRIRRDDDGPADRRPRPARPRRDALRDRRFDDDGEAPRDLSARLLARRQHVAVGAVRDAQPRRRGRARGRFRPDPLRGGVLSDVARLRAAVADADDSDAPPLAEPGGSEALVAVSRGAVRRHLERAGPAARRPQHHRYRAPRNRHGRLSFQREAGGLSALSRAVHRGQRGAAGDRDRQARRHADDPGRGRRRVLP